MEYDRAMHRVYERILEDLAASGAAGPVGNEDGLRPWPLPWSSAAAAAAAAAAPVMIFL